jgi:reductive dehalogenase
MSVFHSIVSRRDFMKSLGFAGAGLGALTASAPIFHDLDEVESSAWGNWKRPWWVKEREFGNPTVELDWKAMQRFNLLNQLWLPNTISKYLGLEKTLEIYAANSADLINGIKNNVPGKTLRDVSLYTAASTYFSSQMPGQAMKSWLGPQKTEVYGISSTPEELGVPRWEGTPEENLKMLRAAMRFFGASQIGVVALDDNERKIISVRDPGDMFNFDYLTQTPPDTDAKWFVFEDVDKGYEGSNKYVLPNKPLWTVSIAIQMSKELFRDGTGALRQAANISRYRIHAMLQFLTQNFLRGIGYQGFGYPISATGALPAQACSILSGLSEMGRNNNYCISPEFGPICGYFSLITDLPLAPTPPIDSGIFRFCHTCNKCAEICPSQAISYDSEPTWEIKPSEIAPDVEPMWTTPGKKTFHTDSPKCATFFHSNHGYCGRCMGTCVFNTNMKAMVHDVVRATVGTTGLFNGFLWNADKAFGYGLVPPEKWEEWWDKDYPVLGQDSTIGSYYGGY